MKKTNLRNIVLAIVMALWTFTTVNAQQNDNLIKAQLASEREKYGLTDDDISGYLITDQYNDEQTGLSYNYIQQRHHNIAVFNAIGVCLIRDNKVVYFKPQMISNLKQKIKTDKPVVTAEAAIAYALLQLGRTDIAPVKLIKTDANLNTYTYESPAISASPIKVQLVYRAMDEGVFLAWDVSIEMIKEPHWWNVRIDALTGNYLDKNDWTVSCGFDSPSHNCADHQYAPAPAMPLMPLPMPPPLGEYNVYPFPVEAPSFGGRTNLINPENLTASPFGWHDDNGVAGNEYTITRGNNVYAYEDANNDNLPGYAPNSATLQFNYPVDLTQAPIVNQDAAITNLFYVNNRLHDVLYHAGFTEAAGNFQKNNYGRGGLGNDYVNAEAFDGSGTNNANFGTPADGSNPRMQMYLWTAPTPDRDGSFDNGIIAHEYGHGVSNRLTGGPSNSSCLGNAEQGGEGWSDWLALMMTTEASDVVGGGMLTQSRGIGTYALNQATNGVGIRRFPYSVNMSINPQTYADLATSGTGPHNKGEIWCDAIWDMSSFLINDLGFSSDPTDVNAGNNIAMRLVLEGMKLQPCSPGFLDARDAILLADSIIYNNAHRCRIWEAFARRGMGINAVQGSSASSTDQTAGFAKPLFCLVATLPPVAAFNSNVNTINCAGNVLFADASVQPFTWFWSFGDGSSSTVQHPIHQYNSPGVYDVKLVVTNTLGSDSVTHVITVTSPVSATVTATPNPAACGAPVQLQATGTGSTNFTYNLTSIPFAPVTGTPIAGPTGDDVVSGFIPIGFNFPFYNGVQTQLKISTNGFVSFNPNLVSSTPSAYVAGLLPNGSSILDNLIAVCWTDLNVVAPGTIDYFNLTSPNRFVIRWNNVIHYQGAVQVTAEIILYESGVIEMHNTSILPNGNMTQGIENAGGTKATVVAGRNQVSFSATNDAYRFTPGTFYTYNWQPGNLNGASQTVTPVSNSTFTVYVADGSGCIVPVTAPAITVLPLAPVITGNTPLCGGGFVTLDAGTYAGYSWSTGATTQTINVDIAGTFTVTVTSANGCTGTASVTTSLMTAPAITGNLTPCTGSSTTLSTGVYSSYLWSTGATTQSIVVSANGTYIVTVTNSTGCTATATAKVVKKTRPVIAVTPADANLCPPATSVALTASGNAATYSWSPATGLNVTTGTAVTASPAATTSYTVTGTSTFGCTTTAAAKITVKPKPINLTTTNILATSAQANWTIVDCATGYTVQYRLAGGTWLSVQVNTNIGTRTLTGLQASSNYQWRIKAKYPNGTTGAYTSPVNFTTPALRIGETVTVNALQVYPNPATDKLNLEFPFTEGDATITVVNALGQTVLTQKNNDAEGSIELNIQSLTEGLYFVTVKNGDNTFNSRFVKK